MLCQCCGQSLDNLHWADYQVKNGKTKRQRTLNNLIGVIPVLSAITIGALDRWSEDTGLHWAVISGVRTLAQQQHNVAIGASRTLKSFHLPQADGFGHAVDIGIFDAGTGDYISNGYSAYKAVADAFKREASKYPEWRLVWGGDWEGFNDPSHFQIEKV